MHQTLGVRKARYRSFTERHSKAGDYDPELGLGGLLLALSPDTKAVVLSSMMRERPYHSARQLHKEVGDYLELMGLRRDIFPLTHRSVWTYYSNRTGNGSLVSTGAAVKQAFYTPEGMKTVYFISEAGVELAKPLIVNAAEWVKWVRESDVPHKYDSMWRVLGKSAKGKRKPLALHRIVEFLIKNPGYHRRIDLDEKFSGEIDDTTVSEILNSLGDAGIIDYESPDRDVQGKKAGGWSSYRLKQAVSYEEALTRIKNIDTGFRRPGYLRSVIGYLAVHQNEIYERNSLASILHISRGDVSRILVILDKAGILERASDFRENRSMAAANDLTRSLYEMLLVPAKETAETLKPPHDRQLTGELTGTLLYNYQEERTHTGPEGGQEVRDIALHLLSENGEMKVSHIAEEGNKLLADRQMRSSSWMRQLQNLQKLGTVEKVGRGTYRLKQE